MFKNEKGITLIETLATLVIFTFVATILYSLITLAMNYNTIENSKTKIQQETNFIVTELQRMHRTTNCYVLAIDHESVRVADNCTDITNAESLRKISSSFNYGIGTEQIERVYQVFPHGRDASQNEGIDILDFIIDSNLVYGNLQIEDFTVSDLHNDDLRVMINFALTRYHESGQEEIHE